MIPRPALIGCDMDSILAALLPEWLRWHNLHWQPDVTPEMVTQWNMARVVSPACGKQIFTLLDDPHLYERVPPLDGALAGITALHDAGHDIVVATAVAGGDGTYDDKQHWLQRHLPWLGRDNAISCTRKELLGLDVLIDDSPATLVQYRRCWPSATLVCIDYPYNHDVPVDYRAIDYRTPGSAWQDLVAFLLRRFPPVQLVKS